VSLAAPFPLAVASVNAAAGADDLLSRPIVLVVALALVSLLPFAFMTATAFVKIATVLQIVRSAIGAQGVPSGTILMALSAALAVVAMAPVGDRIAARAAPLLASAGADKGPDTIALVRGGVEAVREPLRDFLRANASETERQRFFDVARRARHERTGGNGSDAGVTAGEVGPDDLTVVLPAFVVTELGTAFAVGFLIYLPFLVIDLVVSNLLLALGMQMMSPTQVSLPFKLLLFVAIDGWGLLAKALVEGYR
jgi:type III secretion protein R